MYDTNVTNNPFLTVRNMHVTVLALPPPLKGSSLVSGPGRDNEVLKLRPLNACAHRSASDNQPSWALLRPGSSHVSTRVHRSQTRCSAGTHATLLTKE